MKKTLVALFSLAALLGQQVHSTCCGGGGIVSSTEAPARMDMVAIPFEWRSPNGINSGEFAVVTWMLHAGSTQLAFGSGGSMGHGTLLVPPTTGTVTFTFSSSYQSSGGHPPIVVSVPGYGCRASDANGQVVVDIPVRYLPPGSSVTLVPPIGGGLPGGPGGGPLPGGIDIGGAQITLHQGGPTGGGGMVFQVNAQKKEGCEEMTSEPGSGTSHSSHTNPANPSTADISFNAGPGTSTYTDGVGAFQQAVTPSSVMDAQTKTGGYDLSVYSRNAALGTPAENGSFTNIPETTAPLVRYEVRSLSSTEMAVTEKRPNLPDRVSTITKLGDGNWKLAEGPASGAPVRVETIQRTAPGTNGEYSLIREVANGSGGGAVIMSRIQQDINAAGLVTKETIGTGGATRVIDHLYTGATYEGFTDTDGAWAVVSDDGTTETVHRPLALPPTIPPTVGTSRSEVITAGLAANSQKTERTRGVAMVANQLVATDLVKEFIGGVQVGEVENKTTCSKTDLGAQGWISLKETKRVAGSNRISKSYTHGPLAPAYLKDRPAGFIGEDGIAEAYRYEKGELDGQGVFTASANGSILKKAHLRRVDTGGSDNPQSWTPIANKTTISTTFENAMGSVVREETGIATGASTSEAFGSTTYTRDDEGNVTAMSRNGREVYSATRQGPRVSSFTNEEGEAVTYSDFDYDYRPKRAVTAGFAGDGPDAPARPGTQVDVTYDAFGRVLTEARRDSGTATAASTASRIYDVRGRVTSETNDGVTVTTAYGVSDGGGIKVTKTHPGGIAEVAHYSRSGKIHLQTLNGATVRAYIGGPVDQTISTSDMATWETEILGANEYSEKTYRNRFGEYRSMERYQPGTGAVMVKESNRDSKGRVVVMYENYAGVNSGVRSHSYDDVNDKVTITYPLDGMGTTFSSWTKTYYEKIGQIWYWTSENNIGEKTRRQLSGFGPNGAGPEWVVASLYHFPAQGSQSDTTQTTYHNRATGLKRVLTARNGVTNLAEEKYRHGNLESSLSFKGGARAVYSYDGLLRMKTTRDAANGATTELKYEDAAFPFQATEIKTTAAGQGAQPSTVTTRSYVPGNLANAGQVASVTTDGQTTSYTYNTKGQVETVSGATYPVRYEYNGLGSVTKLHTFRNTPNPTWSNGQTTTWYYHNGGLLSKTDAAGKSVTYTYDGTGRVATRTWARGVVSNFFYDRQGRLTKMTRGDGSPVFEFKEPNVEGRYTRVDDDDGIHRFVYTPDGRVIYYQNYESINVLREHLEWTYDQKGRMEKVKARPFGSWITNVNGVISEQTYSYDPATGLLNRTEELASGVAADYLYNPSTPLLNKMETRVGGVKRMESVRTIDGLGRLASTVDTFFPSAGGSFPVEGHTFGYNATRPFERIRDTRTQDGTYWDYGYNGRNEVTSGSRKLSGGTALSGWQFGYNFDLIGNRVDSASGVGSTLNGRDANYTISNSVNQYNSRTVPGAVDIVGETDQPATTKMLVRRLAPPPVEAEYSEPTDATQQGAFFHRAVPVDNSAGPVIAELKTTGVRLGTTDVVRKQTGLALLPAATENFTYDFDGNLTGDSMWTYTWDLNNRLTGMESKPAVPLAAKRKLSFSYDWAGRRVGKKVWVWDSTLNAGAGGWLFKRNARFIYHGWNLIAEANMDQGFEGAAGGNLVRRFIWGKDLSRSLQGAGGVGGLISVDQIAYGPSKDLPVYDGNGNVMAYLDATTGAKKADFAYGPFGESLRATGRPFTDLWMPAEYPIRWSTKYTDEETGLVYYGYRYYQPTMGKWISRDPLSENGGVCLNAYVGNQPVSSTDFLGLEKTFGEIKGQANSMIADAKERGWDVAAGNLQHYMDGSGKDLEISSDWLRRFSAVIVAEETNLARFGAYSGFKRAFEDLKCGESGQYVDIWDASVSYHRRSISTEELFYASGDSHLKSTGYFFFTKHCYEQCCTRGSTQKTQLWYVTISGRINNHWRDRYDWNRGAKAIVLGHGIVYDDDMRALSTYGNAKEFEMFADWTANVEGYYNKHCKGESGSLWFPRNYGSRRRDIDIK